MNNNIPPFLVVKDNSVIGIDKSKNRKPMFENEMCKEAGVMATCNACDRIIFEDEKFKKKYKNNGGYCKECEKANV